MKKPLMPFQNLGVAKARWATFWRKRERQNNKSFLPFLIITISFVRKRD